jgi:hypothetical protein
MPLAPGEIPISYTCNLFSRVVSCTLPTKSTIAGASPGDGQVSQIPYRTEHLASVVLETEDYVTASGLDGTSAAVEVTVKGHLGGTETRSFFAGPIVVRPNNGRNASPTTLTVEIYPTPDATGAIES